MKMSLLQKHSRPFARQCKAQERDILCISYASSIKKGKNIVTYRNSMLSQEGYLAKQVQSGWEETECR